jgi:uncharacterized membrane protein YoaK (UPF0700 family)
MVRYPRTVWMFSACLAALAGFVDALGFMHLGGFFVSFMTGNTTRLAVGASVHLPDTLLAAGLIGLFVVGVILGTLLSRNRPAVSLSLVAALLVGAGAFHALAYDSVAIVLVVLAMGAENTVFQRDGEVSIGLTYVTGTLVKLGQRVATALCGGSRTDWVPYALLWLGLASGAALGAFAYSRIGLDGLWIAAGVSLVLTLWAFRAELDA